MASQADLRAQRDAAVLHEQPREQPQVVAAAGGADSAQPGQRQGGRKPLAMGERTPEDARDVELMLIVKAGLEGAGLEGGASADEAQAAFRDIFNRYNRRLGKFFYLASRDYALAADLIQDTFLKLWGARGRYEATGKFSTFLFQIAKNHWINVREKKLRRPMQFSLDEEIGDGQGDSFQAQFESDQPAPDAEVMGEESRKRLQRAIEALPEKHRMVFLLSQVEGLKHKDIGTILDIPEGTVKSRMFNAISKLRAALEEDSAEAGESKGESQGPAAGGDLQ